MHFSLRHYAAGGALLFYSILNAVPAKPGLQTILQPDGTAIEVVISGDEHGCFYSLSDGTPLRSMNGMMQRGDAPQIRRAPGARSKGLFPGCDFPRKGEQKGLVILVEYTDVNFQSNYDPQVYFSRMLNEDGFADNGATGSARDYFVQNSGGEFLPEFDVYGPVTLPHPQAYYGGNGIAQIDIRAYEMAIDACAAIDGDVDFTEYDRDGNGVIDNVFIFYAGRGEASGGGENCVWPHSADITQILGTGADPVMYDGVQLDHYACANERQASGIDGIGTFVHEFSHVLGLPDLYATSSNFGSNSSFTPGEYSVMDHGPYNNNSRTPPHYSAFELEALGWRELKVLENDGGVVLPDVADGGGCKVVNPGNADEYYIFEYRSGNGWDAYIPGHGMLVWHVHYDPVIWTGNVVNNSPDHQYVDLVEADGIQSESTRAGDPFPGTAGITSFTDKTVPAFKFWNGRSAGLPLTDIRENDGYASFNYGTGSEAPSPVEPLPATEVSHESFVANWEAHSDAEAYLLTVACSGVALDGFSRLNVGNVTSWHVEGLMPSTEYEYTVAVLTAYGESEPSEPCTVTTAMPPLGMRKPVILGSSDVSENGFAFRWEEMDGAVSYLVNVYTKKDAGMLHDEMDFSGYPASVPEGWYSSSKATYMLKGMAGADVPSLRFSNEGDYLVTPAYDDEVRSLSFWCRASAELDGRLCVEAVDHRSGKSVSLAEYEVPTVSGGTVLTCDGIPEGYTRFVITFNKSASDRGSVAIDDVRVGHGVSYIRTPVPGYVDADAGGYTEMTVMGLMAGTTYNYTVTGVGADGLRSLESDEGEVTTVVSGLKEVTVNGNGVSLSGMTLTVGQCPAEIYTMNGTVVATGVKGSVTLPAAGIYIVKVGGEVFKVVAVE